MLFRKDGTDFDLDAALECLAEKYGIEEPVTEQRDGEGKKSKKRKKADGNEDNEEGAEEKPKKEKKTSVMTNEQNRAVAEAIKEMADIYFKNKDPRKGGVFSKAAKALRESETYISSAKEALKLPGVGKGIAGYITEMLEKGYITKLEELRAGSA